MSNSLMARLYNLLANKINVDATLTGSNLVEETTLVNAGEVRDTSIYTVSVPGLYLKKYKTFDIFVRNTHDVTLKCNFLHNNESFRYVKSDGTVTNFSTGNGYSVPITANSYFPLSLMATGLTSLVDEDQWQRYKGENDFLVFRYFAAVAPTSGAIYVKLVGEII